MWQGCLTKASCRVGQADECNRISPEVSRGNRCFAFSTVCPTFFERKTAKTVSLSMIMIIYIIMIVIIVVIVVIVVIVIIKIAITIITIIIVVRIIITTIIIVIITTTTIIIITIIIITITIMIIIIIIVITIIATINNDNIIDANIHIFSIMQHLIRGKLIQQFIYAVYFFV